MTDLLTLIDIKAWDRATGAEVTIRVANAHYRDPDLGLVYHHALTEQPVIDRAAYQPGQIGGFSPAGDTAFTLRSIPGYDDWRGRLLFNNRAIEIRRGLSHQPRRNFTTVFIGTVTEQPELSFELFWRIRFSAQDILRSADRPLPMNRVDDATGLTDGVLLPRGIGLPLNVTPVLTDPALGIFQAVDLSGLPVNLVATIPAAYVRARALDNQGQTGSLQTATFATPTPPAAAAYKYDANGRLRFGAGLTAAELGAVTCDLQILWEGSDSMAIGTAAMVLLLMAGVSASRIDAASFTALDEAYSMPVERWFNTETNALEAASGLLSAVMGYLDVEDGLIVVKRLRRPTATRARDCAASITERLIEGGAVEVQPYPVPPANFSFGYDRNHTVQSDVAGQVTEEDSERAAFATTEWRYITDRTDPATTAAWQADQDLTITTPLRAIDPEDLSADTEGVRAVAVERIQLLTGDVEELSFTVKEAPGYLDIGQLRLDDQIWLTVPGVTPVRGQAIRLTSISEDLGNGRINLRGIT